MLWLFPFFLLVGLFLPGFFVTKSCGIPCVRLHVPPVPARSISQRLLARRLPRPHHPVDRTPRPDRRHRRGSLVGTALPALRRNQTRLATHPPAGSSTHSLERVHSRGTACTQRHRSLHRRRHRVPLGFPRPKIVGPRQIRFLPAAHPRRLSYLFLRRWNPSPRLVHQLVVVRVCGTIPAIAHLPSS